MIRHLQTKSQLIESLGEVKSDWKDSFSVSFLGLIEEFDFDILPGRQKSSCNSPN
jgi:hypothetical protein